MEIILKEDIIGLGYKNDIVDVKRGYGRNYLIPKGKAVIASESAKKVLAEDMKQQAHKLAAKKAEAEKKGFAVDRKIITMRDIKKVGEYEATIHFHKEVEVKVPVTVVAENAPKAEVKSDNVDTEKETGKTVDTVETAELEQKDSVEEADDTKTAE